MIGFLLATSWAADFTEADAIAALAKIQQVQQAAREEKNDLIVECMTTKATTLNALIDVLSSSREQREETKDTQLRDYLDRLYTVSLTRAEAISAAAQECPNPKSPVHGTNCYADMSRWRDIDTFDVDAPDEQAYAFDAPF